MRLFVTLLLFGACGTSEPAGTTDAGALTSTRDQLDQQACYAEFEQCYRDAPSVEDQNVCEYALEDCIEETGGRPPVEQPECDDQLQQCLDEGYDPDECEEEADACRQLQGS